MRSTLLSPSLAAAPHPDTADLAEAYGVGGRIIAFIQDAHCHLAKAKRRRAIEDIMKAQGIPDFQAPPPIPKFIDAMEATDELPSYDSFEPSPDDF
jgi:hypothetical protein